MTGLLTNSNQLHHLFSFPQSPPLHLPTSTLLSLTHLHHLYSPTTPSLPLPTVFSLKRIPHHHISFTSPPSTLLFYFHYLSSPPSQVPIPSLHCHYYITSVTPLLLLLLSAIIIVIKVTLLLPYTLH